MAIGGVSAFGTKKKMAADIIPIFPQKLEVYLYTFFFAIGVKSSISTSMGNDTFIASRDRSWRGGSVY